MPDFDPVRILETLAAHDVDFIVIGGVAARLRGAPLLTQDVDITPDVDRRNLDRLAEALNAMGARLRSATEPDGVVAQFDVDLLETAELWTLATRAGDLDLAMKPDGTGGYRDLARDADDLTISRSPKVVVAVASLADVIRSKEAAGREKDRAALPMLRRTLEELESQ